MSQAIGLSTVYHENHLILILSDRQISIPKGIWPLSLDSLAGYLSHDLVPFGKAVKFEPNGTFYYASRGDLSEVSAKRALAPTGFFDYKAFRSTNSFRQEYDRLFGSPVAKPSLPDFRKVLQPA